MAQRKNANEKNPIKAPASAPKAPANGNNAAFKALTLTMLLIVAALAVILASSFLLPSSDIARVSGPPREFRGSFERLPEGSRNAIENFFSLRLALSLLNLALLAYLLYIYTKDYLKIKSNFTLGIIAFLFSFMLYALSEVPLLHLLLGPLGGPNIFSFVPMAFSAIGLLIFAKLGSE